MNKNITDLNNDIVINQCFDDIFNIINKDLNNLNPKDILNLLLDIQYNSIILMLCLDITKRNNIS